MTENEEIEMVDVPSEKLAEYVRELVKMDGEINIHGPDIVDFDKWEVIDEATFKDIEYAHGRLHVFYEYEDGIHFSEKVARATRWQPAEYKNHYLKTLVSVGWDMTIEGDIICDIEVEDPRPSTRH